MSDDLKLMVMLEQTLILAPNTFMKFEENGQILIQNPASQETVSFTKDVLLLLYDFFLPEGGGKRIVDFLINWPPETHEGLIRNIELLTNAEILVNNDYIEKSKFSAEHPEAPTPEKNIHINLINHHYMLKDYVRLSAYRRAIENKITSDSIAMDLGTGTGILAFFAAKAGAKKVYAVERRQDIVDLSKILAKENNIEDQIEYVVGNSTKINPDFLTEKVDVFVSEILGNGIFEENILEYTLDARERFCKPDAFLIPSKVNVHVFGYDNKIVDSIHSEISEVECLYDLNLNKFRELAKNFVSTRYERYNTAIYELMTEQLVAKSIDLKTFTNPYFRDKIELTVSKDGIINAFCAYFSVNLDETTYLTNSPWAPSTHWIQKVFVLPTPLKVQAGQTIPLTSVYDGDYRVELRID